ncbi:MULTISPECIES: GNAT family N-acetyltransferase [unclassified Ruegeria]|uniref:GNAT family N-acetyltransferase n=1 Tax=unclassified Ruegeria TaxID=2625375 RepID=UPI001489CD06|nr:MULTISPECIES: GNAT family N-acetyltransferase [unclassified Ruegeria]NOD34104.1 GNAT family N-acetyltransferase [Ruegeria sp. HKCCD7296]NOD46505.1 GNAT family N-acetyltransferase [Ruegeria sp. HKCCD5849]NOD50195.1 GNAT family N-acetyltransferase [Ruegeria sp. HKCCD5851]NOD67030.1 GNAT family N-acetyltransferase [Ruegeria sp. HKCCD7303]NOE32619.1 GNAT family N-acetyltransferase [Ruegeria sp. HKCCD7318]
MSAALRLARPEDLDRLMALVTAFHAEARIEQDADKTRNALAPLLEGIPHGCVYLIGPGRAPLGYIILTFGWSVEFGGMDGFVDEIYIRPAVRGRGIATEVLLDLPKALAGAGLTALHLEVDRTSEAAQKLYLRTGFKPRDRYMLMSKAL